jgi:hypothetical protein
MADEGEQSGGSESRATAARRTWQSASEDAKRWSSSWSRVSFIGGENQGRHQEWWRESGSMAKTVSAAV